MTTLFLFRGDREILRYPFSGSSLRVGRHPDNDLTLPDGDISRFHLRIEERGGSYWISDQSRNGTTLNGEPVRERLLKNGDRIGLGTWRLVFADRPACVQEDDQETVVRQPTKAVPSFHGILGRSEVMQRLFAVIERAAPVPSTVLILGETGSGKELVARTVHELSARSRRPFVAINCGAISPQLMESELFGHERGAFTGAVSRHAGAFEQAQGGTLFLDEVGELPLELQPKLLRVLEERNYRRVGGAQEAATDARVVAATHRNLQAQVRAGKFREDLFFRLFAVPVFIPPLRERAGDVPFLAQYFLESQQPEASGALKSFSEDALRKLGDHPWRGNVRELKNVVTRSLLFAPGDVIRAEDLLFLSESAEEERPSLQVVEKNVILKTLKENDWNKTKTAEILGIAKSTLFHKIKEYGILEEGRLTAP